MATILYTSTYGSDDPTRASIPFFMALGAIEAGHDPSIVLIGEATYLMKAHLAEQIHGIGWPPLKGLIAQVINFEVPIYI